MKDTNGKDQEKSDQQPCPTKDSRDGSVKKPQGSINIPGGAGAAGQIPIKGNDNKQKDDPLQPDVPDKGAIEQNAQRSAQDAGNNPIPQPQRKSRSDQEQVGRQNPAGDTRGVSREPVDPPDHLTKK